MRRVRSHRKERLSEPPPEKESSAARHLLANSAVIVTLMAAILYFHGNALYQGYLSYWGLSTDLFPLTMENALIHGVHTYLFLGVENWRFLAGLLLYVPALYLLFFFLFFTKPLTVIKRFINSSKTKVINKVQKEVLGELFTVLLRLSIVVTLVLSFIMATHFSGQKGRELAGNQHQKYLAGDYGAGPFKEVTIVYLDEIGKATTVSGDFLESSASLYALYTQEGVLVLPFSRITSIHFLEDKTETGET